ncbi:MAG: hypothetical protein U9N30_03960 [Campylobacterota bacterium]|nr:hypothetical protein [Campylobacterota bacterium]
MEIDMLIPLVILGLIIGYLLYSRSMYEKEVVEVYEEKLKQWKEHSDNTIVSYKELVGLVYDQDYELTIETLDDKCVDRLSRGKFHLKER